MKSKSPQKKPEQPAIVQPKRGRPVDESKRAAILDAATRLFMSKGFHATSMDEIAAAASMSKLTLYRRFSDKNTLFRAVVERKCQAALLPNLYETIKGGSPQQAIGAFCRAFLELLMSDDAINLYRMMMAEAAQSPDMTQMFFDAGPARVKKMVEDMLTDFKTKKVLKNIDIKQARHTLLSLLTGSEIYMKVLLNIDKKPSRKAIDVFIKQTTNLFVVIYFKSNKSAEHEGIKI